MNFLIGFLTVVLVLVSLFMILVVLMQRGNANGGLGAAMGGGAAESAFGAETTNVLTKTTRNTAIVFFVMVFGLYLGRLYVHQREMAEQEGLLPEIEGGAPQSSATNALQELISQAEKASEEGEAEADAVVEEAEQAAEESAPSSE